MNLITAQQDNPTARLINTREPIVVHIPDSLPNIGYLTRYGPIGQAHSTFHQCPGESTGLVLPLESRSFRPCVHAIDTPPKVTLWSIDPTLQLGWQPRVITHWLSPCIAARRGDVVTVAFDCMGDVDGCTNRPTLLPDRFRWSYKLFPFIWDDMPDKVNETVWLGVWND